MKPAVLYYLSYAKMRHQHPLSLGCAQKFFPLNLWTELVTKGSLGRVQHLLEMSLTYCQNASQVLVVDVERDSFLSINSITFIFIIAHNSFILMAMPLFGKCLRSEGGGTSVYERTKLMLWRTHAFGQVDSYRAVQKACVCISDCVCVPAKCVYDFVLEPASDSQQCLITALLRNNGLLGFQTSHSAHYFLQLYRLIKLSFFLLQTDSLFPFLNPHFPMHIMPPYSLAPHSWDWRSNDGVWAIQPAALLNPTCQAEQKPTLPFTWMALPSLFCHPPFLSLQTSQSLNPNLFHYARTGRSLIWCDTVVVLNHF